MKSFFTVLLILLQYTICAQQCELFSPMKEGSKLEYTEYNKNGKPQSKSIHTVTQVVVGDQPEAVINAKLIEKKKEVLNRDYKVKCVDGNFYVDMIRFFDQKKLSEQQDFELEIDGDFLELPALMQPDMNLKNGSIDIRVNTNAATLVTLTMNIFNRKVQAKEKLTTPAGTFECFKITFDYESKFGILNFKGKGVEWVAIGYGVIRSENYNKNGKLRAYQELTAIE